MCDLVGIPNLPSSKWEFWSKILAVGGTKAPEICQPPNLEVQFQGVPVNTWILIILYIYVYINMYIVL